MFDLRECVCIGEQYIDIRHSFCNSITEDYTKGKRRKFFYFATGVRTLT